MNKLMLNLLVYKVKQGDEDAFAKLYQQTHKGVFSYSYSIVQNYHVAEDITQETFIKVKQNVHRYKDNTNFSAWLLQIAKNLSFNYLSKAKRESVTDDFSAYGVDPKVDEMAEVLNKALDIDERQIVVLHAVAGYKHREIAEILGKPVGTVTWMYKNALAKLKKYLTQEVGK